MVLLSTFKTREDQVDRRLCDFKIQQLQIQARQFEAQNRRLPSRDLLELTEPGKSSHAVTPCPVDGRRYQLDTRSGLIVPHNHH
jgi:hypothetical protein